MRQMMNSAAGKKVSDAEVNTLFQKGDIDGDGQIDMHEFIRLMFPKCSEGITKLQNSFGNLNEVKAAFRKFDADGDGHITRQELKGVMAKFSDSEVDAVFALGDIDQDGEISLSEFVRLMCPAAESGLNRFRNSFRNIQEVIAAFKRFDENCDGSLSQQELVAGTKSLGLNLTSAEVKAIFTLADVNQDGEVNYTEFVSALYPVASDGVAKLRSSLKDVGCV